MKVLRKNMQTSLSGEVRRSVIRGDCETETVNTVINNRKKLEHIDRMEGNSLKSDSIQNGKCNLVRPKIRW
jgi:hypothetical protein